LGLRLREPEITGSLGSRLEANEHGPGNRQNGACGQHADKHHLLRLMQMPMDLPA
jgi:hypothetical protein